MLMLSVSFAIFLADTMYLRIFNFFCWQLNVFLNQNIFQVRMMSVRVFPYHYYIVKEHQSIFPYQIGAVHNANGIDLIKTIISRESRLFFILGWAQLLANSHFTNKVMKTIWSHSTHLGCRLIVVTNRTGMIMLLNYIRCASNFHS